MNYLFYKKYTGELSKPEDKVIFMSRDEFKKLGVDAEIFSDFCGEVYSDFAYNMSKSLITDELTTL